MGANAQIEVPAFTAGQVLTAAEMTQINTGIPVFATTTTRDAAFGGAGEKVLAEGQFAYIEASDTTQYYNGSSWVSVGVSGLTLVASGTFSAVSSFSTAAATFTATYDNYLVNVYGDGSTGATVGFRFNASGSAITTGYYGGLLQPGDNGASPIVASSNATSLQIGAIADTTYTGMQFSFNVYDATTATHYPSISGQGRSGTSTSSQQGNFYGGSRLVKQAVDGFTMLVSAGTMTGKYKVYGYQN